MKNAMRFFCLTLATFMVAIACGGNPPPTDGQNPNNPEPGMMNPDPNHGCEPNCPTEIATVMRGLTSPTSGDFINLNSTRVVDSEGHPILTAGETMVMIQIPTTGPTPMLEIIERREDGTDGHLRANSSGRNFMPEMAGNPIALWYWVYGVYPDGSGDWFDFDRPGAASDPWEDRLDVEYDARCLAEGGWGWATRRRIGSLGQVGVPQLCNHDDRTVSLCACRDPNGGNEPVLCPGCTDSVMVWGTLSFPENKGEVLDLTIISFLEDPPYRSQRKFGRQL